MSEPAHKFELPPGMGYFALYLPWPEIRRVAELPPDVDAIRVLPGNDKPLHQRVAESAWRADPPIEPFYLLIRHPYFPRVPPNGIYEVARIDKVLEQYSSIFKRLLEGDQNAVA